MISLSTPFSLETASTTMRISLLIKLSLQFRRTRRFYRFGTRRADAIDAIDLEIQNSYTPEQREYYLGRLKALTEKMAAC